MSESNRDKGVANETPSPVTRFGWSNPYEQDPRLANDVRSIATGRERPFCYSPWFLPHVVIAQADITMTGNRPRDYRLAEAASGVTRAEKQVWHHVFMPPGTPRNRCTMQLVPEQQHKDTVPHVGGFNQWVAMGGKVTVGAPEEVSEHTLAQLRRDLTERVAKFSAMDLGFDTTRTQDLRDLYERLADDEGVLRNLLTRQFGPEGMQIADFLPLDTTDSGVFMLALEEKEKPTGREFVADGALPFATTAGGDIFYLKPDGQVWLYDSEMVNPPTRIAGNVAQLINHPEREAGDH